MADVGRWRSACAACCTRSRQRWLPRSRARVGAGWRCFHGAESPGDAGGCLPALRRAPSVPLRRRLRRRRAGSSQPYSLAAPQLSSSCLSSLAAGTSGDTAQRVHDDTRCIYAGRPPQARLHRRAPPNLSSHPLAVSLFAVALSCALFYGELNAYLTKVRGEERRGVFSTPRGRPQRQHRPCERHRLLPATVRLPAPPLSTAGAPGVHGGGPDPRRQPTHQL
jgi:hypothetical protein